MSVDAESMNVADDAAPPAGPDIPLTVEQRGMVRQLAWICRWLGRATLLIGIAALAITAFLAVTILPTVGFQSGMGWALVGPTVIGVGLIWQATAASDAGKAFGELDDSAYAGMVAHAIGRTSRYFSVDAVLFWGLAALTFTCPLAVGVS